MGAPSSVCLVRRDMHSESLSLLLCARLLLLLAGLALGRQLRLRLSLREVLVSRLCLRACGWRGLV